MKNDTYSLNSDQKKAVEYNQGPLLIVAGAGTGKTSVITEKVRYIIEKNQAKPDEILALTFTEKAAREMEDRVDQTLPYGYFQMWISTFHSFADQILREEIANIGLNPGYKLMTQAETVIFLRNNLFLFDLKYFRPLGNPHKFLEALLNHFSRLKDENISPQEYMKWTDKQKEDQEKNQELAHAYDMYQKIKIREGYFDFSDLIFYLIQLFSQRKDILRKYHQQFKYILVDEFQDTNITQYELVKLLCASSSNPKLTVVGDDSQAIYKFRGASVSNILTFMKDYPKAKQITLQKNYRSYQEILDSSYKLIKNNDPDTLEAQLGINKKLHAERDGKGKVDFFLADRVEDEAEYVTAEILKLRQKYKLSDFAVLVRANDHANPFIRALSQKGLPYQFLGPGMLFKQPEVKDLVAYLNFLADPEDSVSLYRVLNMDIFKVDRKDLALILSFCKRTNLSLFNAIEIVAGSAETAKYQAYLPLITDKTKGQLQTIYTIFIKHLKLIKRETAGQMLYYFLEDTTFLKKLANYKTLKDEKIAINISKFFDRLKKFESGNEDASIFAVVDFIKMSMELGESPLSAQDDISGYDAVNILTVHSAKGLEFPVVFMVNLSRGRFPTFERKEKIPIPDDLIKEILPQGDYHLLEERRLFYVAMTRAMNNLYLTASMSYTEGRRERKVSPFVYETFGDSVVNTKFLTKKEERNQLSIFDFKKVEENLIKKEYFGNNFSYSQIDTYLLCPLRYKYQYILKIPMAPNAAASFGSTIHTALYRFYQEFIKNKALGLKELIEIYENSWIPLGYSSKTHQQRMKKEGLNILTGFFKTFHDNNLKIIDLEKLFKIKVDNNTYITGKIDRVDQSPSGAIEIIDYKTGKKPSEKDLKKSLQLSIYLLAATDRGLYNKPIDQITLSFYYLQDMDKISIKKTREEIDELKGELKDSIEGIRTSDFAPRVGPWCDFCPFRMICEAWQ